MLKYTNVTTKNQRKLLNVLIIKALSIEYLALSRPEFLLT